MSHLLPKFTLGLACFGFLGGSSAQAEPSETKGPVLKDVSKQVEVVVDGRLRTYAPGYAEVGVSLWNSSEKDLVGPIYLVVDDSGAADVTVANHPEQTESGKGVFEVVPEGKSLLSHGMTDSISMVFAVPAGFDGPRARTFDLASRVLGREGADKSRKALDREDDATLGKSYNQEELDRVMAIQDKHTPDLLSRKGVMGTSLVEDSKGNLAIRVYSETRGMAKTLPGTLDGITVDVKPVPGGFSADPARDTVIFRESKAQGAKSRQSKSGDSLVTPGDPTIRFDRPVPIGVSAFNATETICATGTLGCRCIDSSGKLYGLSNSHVFSKEGASSRGEIIVQPGQGDNNCNTDIANNTIGLLYDFVPSFIDPTDPLFVNFMDTALMEVVEAEDPDGNLVPAVGAATPSDGYGAPSNRIIRNPRIGQLVQKYGRTTVYTRGFVQGINVTAVVAGGAGLKPYEDLIEFIGVAPYALFGGPGDSGSLIVTLHGNRPIALLFAGGGGQTLANPIGPILDRYNVRVDDGQDEDARTGGGGTEGISGREGIGLAQLGQDDRFRLPPELRGRIKNPQRGIIPAAVGPQTAYP